MVCALCPPAKSTTHQSPGHLEPALALASLQSCRMQYSHVPSHIHAFTAPLRHSPECTLGLPGCQLPDYKTHTALFLCICSQLQVQATTEPAMIQLLAGWENKYMGCISSVHGSILSSSNPCTNQQAYTENKIKNY